MGLERTVYVINPRRKIRGFIVYYFFAFCLCGNCRFDSAAF